MSCDSTSLEYVAEEVYLHLCVNFLPNESTTYQRNKHITILRAVPRVTGGPTVLLYCILILLLHFRDKG
jgi:hypothetical protein